jgi:hypothetical protein
MNIVINTEKCNSDNITIFKNSKYKTRIGYKEDKLHLNGLCLNLNLQGLCILYIHQCYKCTFGYQKNKAVLDKLIQLEKDILSKYVCPITTKRPVYNISRQLTETPGTISLSHIKRGLYKSVVIKIIGIWESENEYGLIYFFYPTNLEPYSTQEYKPTAAPIPTCVYPCRIFRYPSTCINS